MDSSDKLYVLQELCAQNQVEKSKCFTEFYQLNQGEILVMYE
ncbi:unnamed protein product [Arabidopsis halleri]